MSAEAGRHRCLSCDRPLAEGELFCLACGGVPFGIAPGGRYALVVHEVPSTDLRKQVAALIAEQIPGLDAFELEKKLARRTLLAAPIDAAVGQAFVERLKKLHAPAEVVERSSLQPSLAGRLLQPLAWVGYGLGVVGAIALTAVWPLLVGAAVGVGLGLWRKKPAELPFAQPDALPPPPPKARELIALVNRSQGADRELLLGVARGVAGLLTAAHREGLSVEVATVDGVGRAISDVVDDVVTVGGQAMAGDAAARQRLDQIAAGVSSAAQKLGQRALPPAPEQRLLDQAEVVQEIASLSNSN
ncbi:MAG: hypothetical protein JXR83_08530 [Deltaproteobacteria bacterium]|nr:hypothetical protein [Deltaproteobacteria bacterium]